MNTNEKQLDSTAFVASLWLRKEDYIRTKRGLIIMFSISALACVIGILFWNDDHVYTTERFSLSRGLTTYTTGWPVYTAMWGGIMAGIFLISGLLWFFKYDKITPAIGFDEAGIFINCYNIKKTHVSWNQISEILTADRSASIHLVNPQEIVRTQSSQARRRTLEYALKSGILTIYAVDFDGDFKEFTEKLTAACTAKKQLEQ